MVNEQESSRECRATPHLGASTMVGYDIESTVISWIGSNINIL